MNEVGGGGRKNIVIKIGVKDESRFFGVLQLKIEIVKNYDEPGSCSDHLLLPYVCYIRLKMQLVNV